MSKPVKRAAESELLQTPTKSTHTQGEQHYDKLDELCSKYILNGPGGFDTKEEEEDLLSKIKMHRGFFDFSAKIVDRLVCRLRIFDLISTITLPALHAYTDEDWAKLMKTLTSLRVTLRSTCAQKIHIPVFCAFDTVKNHFSDADIPFVPAENTPAPGAMKECFEGPFIRLYEECSVHRVLSTIRKKLDMADQLADGSTLPLILSTQHIQTFIAAVEKHFTINNREFFYSMLKMDGDNVVGLLPAAELKKKAEKYNLKSFYSSLVLLLQHWSTTLGTSSPIVKYPGTAEKKVTGEDEIVVQGYAVADAHLDLLDESVTDLPVLSSPPTPAANKHDPKQSTPLSSSKREKKKRMRFTDDEKNSIKLGLEIHGKGNWAAIKREFPDVLINRTSVQIKDCYRTMVKLGEIVEPPKEGTEGDGDDTAANAKDDGDEEMKEAAPGETHGDEHGPDGTMTHV